MILLQKIKELRKERGFSQKYMAEKLNISISGYGKIELGENVLSIERFLDICRILGIKSYNQLLPTINDESINKIEKVLISGGLSFENIRANCRYAINLTESLKENIEKGTKPNEQIIEELDLVLKLLDLIRSESFKHGYDFQTMMDIIEMID